jgi:choline/glycine/proline betaine transport protein
MGIDGWSFQSLFIIFLVRQWPKEELLKQLRKLKFTLTLGFHAWAVYALVGLSLAYFTYSRGLHLLLGLFFILLGDKIYGRIEMR